MKKAKIFFTSLMVFLFALSVMGSNNFNLTWDVFGFEDDKTISKKEIEEYVGKQLVNPIRDCYVEAYPHALMSKCPSEFYFSFDKPRWATEDYEPTYYKGQPVQGDLIFLDCSVERHIGKVQVNVTKEVCNVQESFFSDWVPSETFVSSFCKKISNQAKEK